MASAPVSRFTLLAARVSQGTLALGLASIAALGLTLGGTQVAHASSLTVTQPVPKFAIRIVPGSDIHLVAKSSKLPISIRNDYNAEIRVQVHVAPSNLNALVPASIEVVVPALTTYVAQVPVTAIADGDVPLKAWLTTFSGLPLGDAVKLNLSVNAEIEGSLIAGFTVIVAGLGVAGVVRTLAKRRALKQDQS
jgi:hypothetical protein